MTSITTLPRCRLAALSLAGSLVLGCGSVRALENGALRIAPGWGGGELALPLLPGLSGTLGMAYYDARHLKDNEGNTPQMPVAPGVDASVGMRARSAVVIPRIVWISEHKLLGAHVGLGGLVPFFDRRQTVTLEGQFPAGTPAPVVAGTQAALDAQAGALGGRRRAMGDLELAPVLSWPGDRSNVVFIAAVIFPTGQYDPKAPVNAGAGRYRTFRPTMSYGYAGDGWDAGVRGAIAFNTRNTDTQVRSGAYVELDGSLLKSVGESLRAGLQGYGLQQLQADNGPGVPAHGNKSRALALGPAVSWVSSDASWLVDVKLLQEFAVRNRTEGRMAWISASYRF